MLGLVAQAPRFSHSSDTSLQCQDLPWVPRHAIKTSQVVLRIPASSRDAKKSYLLVSLAVNSEPGLEVGLCASSNNMGAGLGSTSSAARGGPRSVYKLGNQPRHRASVQPDGVFPAITVDLHLMASVNSCSLQGPTIKTGSLPRNASVL